MVFSSVPIYLDPPHWNQQPTHPASATGGGAHPQPPPPQQRDGSTSTTTSSARPGSMAERARLAKVPQPEPGLPCPRCESTNTKFCYFNNYSLSQPRHFCKTCRRYWTRGGALRNVPVGGGCRRNKRTKSGGGSKSSGAGHAGQPPVAGGACAAGASSSGAAAGSEKLLPPQLPFSASLHQLPDYAAAETAASIRLNLGGMHHPLDAVDDFQVGAYPGVGLQQWRLQYPFMSGLEPTAAPLLPFDGVEAGVADRALIRGLAGQVPGKPSASAKTEDNLQKQQELSLPKQYLGGITGNVHYWIDGGGGDAETTGGSGGGWADFSGYNPSSTSNNNMLYNMPP